VNLTSIANNGPACAGLVFALMVGILAAGYVPAVIRWWREGRERP